MAAQVGWVASIAEATFALPTSERLTNFYLHDSDEDSPFRTTAAQRRANLWEHLRRVEHGDLVLVGEAAGWRGARQSGVAFTAAPMLGLPGTPEATASIVQDAVVRSGLEARTLLWNALPMHPYTLAGVRTNRTPTGAELSKALYVLSLAISGRHVFCVGRSAARAVSTILGSSVPALSDASPSDMVISVRHPSFGGSGMFRTDYVSCVHRWFPEEGRRADVK